MARSAHAALVHAFTLSIIPAAASFVMARNSDLEVPRNAVIATYLGSLLTIYTVAAAFWLMVRLDSREAPLTRCMQVAAYGATPVLLASVALFTPVLVLVCVITLPYVFYLYYLGVQEPCACPRTRRRSSSPSRSSQHSSPRSAARASACWACYRIVAWTRS